MSPVPLVAAAAGAVASKDEPNVSKPTWGDQLKSLIPYAVLGIVVLLVIVALFWLAVWTGYRWIDGQCSAEGYSNLFTCAFGGTASALTGAVGGALAGLNPFTPASNSPRDRAVATGNTVVAWNSWPVLSYIFNIGGMRDKI